MFFVKKKPDTFSHLDSTDQIRVNFQHGKIGWLTEQEWIVSYKFREDFPQFCFQISMKFWWHIKSVLWEKRKITIKVISCCLWFNWFPFCSIVLLCFFCNLSTRQSFLSMHDFSGLASFSITVFCRILPQAKDLKV